MGRGANEGAEEWSAPEATVIARLRLTSAFWAAAIGAFLALTSWVLLLLNTPTSKGTELRSALEVEPYRTAGAILVALVVSGALLELVHRWLQRGGRTRQKDHGPLRGRELHLVLREVRERIEALRQLSTPIAPRVLDELFRGALELEASDLHSSPSAQGAILTYRVHGSLYEVARLTPPEAQALGIRVKVLSELETYSRKPQDGRLRVSVDGTPLEARVSVVPADTGERLVLRLVRGGRQVPELEGLGLSRAVTRSLAEILEQPQGMLILSGPVGSGKTTTLYSSLAHIKQTRGQTTAIVSLEDPVELKLPFLTQIQINKKVGLDFPDALRSILRQDPNVIMVGEIRDRVTAEIASQAGLTGHLILTTLHVDRASLTFARLLDMGVEPFVVASATLGCLSQRLLRVLCVHCRRPFSGDTVLEEKLTRLGVTLEPDTYFEPVGCERCDGQGYSGRTPIAELLVVTPELRRKINEGAAPLELEEEFRKSGSKTLFETGLDVARVGETSLAEVLRVAI